MRREAMKTVLSIFGPIGREVDRQEPLERLPAVQLFRSEAPSRCCLSSRTYSRKRAAMSTL